MILDIIIVLLMAILSMSKDITICDEPEVSLEQEDKFIVIENIDTNKEQLKEN